MSEELKLVKIISISLFFIGIIFAIIGYYTLYPNCPKKYIQNESETILQEKNASSIEDIQFSQKPSEIYVDMFEQPTPWIHGIGIGFQKDPLRVG